jgi:hypothetical protein
VLIFGADANIDLSHEQRSQKRGEMEYIIQTTPRFNGEEQGMINDS